jgi:peroxiredoxin
MSSQTIADQVSGLHEHMAGHAPAEVLHALTTEQAALNAGGIPASVLRPGSRLADADLLDAHGKATTLTAARKNRPSVVVFYRGAWCPYCNITLRTYQAQLVPELTRRGIELIAISPQKPDGSLSMQETNELSFTVLSDPGNQIAGTLGILTAPSDAAAKAQATMGLDVAEHNADGTKTIPMPTVIVLDADGVIRWIDVHPNYTTRTEAQQILAAIAETV